MIAYLAQLFSVYTWAYKYKTDNFLSLNEKYNQIF